MQNLRAISSSFSHNNSVLFRLSFLHRVVKNNAKANQRHVINTDEKCKYLNKFEFLEYRVLFFSCNLFSSF